ncbi:PEP-CTERM sorting domain-containing protein [Kiritimatiella glycovorans]|uniref:Ice-binding protein C-terminal domain-containing protein n=1 Tax=Kiritimatiella glycovorans TaxID=1307763 RepID=A0A0G3EB22_9BACT|nr:PEP-CTERM sorting domain-containing protein [Kiritimatiella glycovorans]AKJ63691.1 hypothetical protein L21SP4_00411 [Kiritimatiella glycovorans]
MKKLSMALVLVMAAVLCAGAQTELTFDNDWEGFNGRLDQGWNWENNTQPLLSSNRVGILTGSEPNLTNYWSAGAFDDYWIEQRGGTFADDDYEMRIRYNARYTLNDTGNDGSYTNIMVTDQQLSLWSNGGTNWFNLIAGTVYADKTFANSDLSRLTLSNAMVTILTNAINNNAQMTALSGGTGIWHQINGTTIPEIDFEDPDGDPTVGDNHFMGAFVWETNGGSALIPAQWKWYIGNEDITYAGHAMQTTNAASPYYWEDYVSLSDDNTTLTVIPEPATLGMLGLAAAGLAVLRRMKRV